MSHPPTYEHACQNIRPETAERHLNAAAIEIARLSDENRRLDNQVSTLQESNAALSGLQERVTRLEAEAEARASTGMERNRASRDLALPVPALSRAISSPLAPTGGSSRSTTGGRLELPSFPVMRPSASAIASLAASALAVPSSSSPLLPTGPSSSRLLPARAPLASASAPPQPSATVEAQASASLVTRLAEARLMERAEAVLRPAAVTTLRALVDFHDRARTDAGAEDVVRRIMELFISGGMPVDSSLPIERVQLRIRQQVKVMQDLRDHLARKRRRCAGPSGGRM